MPDDKLALSIWNHNDLSIGSVFSIYNSNEAFGKWVLIDQRGMAVFPKLGPVKISGLTVKEAEDLLGELYGEVLKEPVLTLKVLNRSVDVVGEVVMPGKVILEKERPTLMEVVGECRGFSGYADIERIEIIRDNVRYTVNLRELSEYHTYGLVMQSGDILHVPSRSGKRLEQSAPVIIPFASVITALSLVATIVLSQ
jgi:polysaccharide export outer membrane protein